MSLKNTGKISQIKIGTKKVYIVLNNNERIEVSYQVYKSLNLKEGQTFNKNDLSHIDEIKLEEKLFSYAIKLTTSSSISINELAKRLYKRKADEKLVNKIITKIKDEKLIDEEDLINDYVECLHNKMYGINRIKNYLIQKGFDKDLIKNIYYDEDIEQDIANVLIKQLEKKYSKSNYESIKQKCYRKLTYNGFENNVINNAIKLLDGKLFVNEINSLRNDLKIAKRKYLNKCSSKDFSSNVVKYLLSKGYRYSDIELIKGEIQNEMD